MEIRVLYACTVCRHIVEWNYYKLPDMFGKRIVCVDCQRKAQ